MTADAQFRLAVTATNASAPRLLRFRALRLPSVGTLLALTFLVLIALAAILPDLLSPYDPYETDSRLAFQAPSSAHWFGTDHAGRDLFSRIVHGTRQSLAIGVLATLIGLAGGLLLGLTSALSHRFVDAVIGRFIEVLFVFPTILLALVLITFLGTGIVPLIIAVGVGTIADNARLIRAQAMRVRRTDYVVASRALGRTSAQVLVTTTLPNVVRPILVIATLGVGSAILWASSLSFLGFGAQPPSPEWGSILADGRNYIQTAWWISVFPGVMIVLSALSTTIAGRHLQRRSEGR